MFDTKLLTAVRARSSDSFEILPCLEQFGRELSRCFEEATISVEISPGKDAG